MSGRHRASAGGEGGAAPTCPAIIAADIATATVRGQEARGASLAEARELLQLAVRARTVSYLLHPPLLKECGLAAALASHATGFARRSELECELDLDDTPPGAMRPSLEVALYRVAQEVLADVHRYSGAYRARVRLRVLPGSEVELRVEDDGRGFRDPLRRTRRRRRRGRRGALARCRHPGMRARLRQFGGTLRIGTGAGGTRVVAPWPNRSLPTPCRTRADDIGTIRDHMSAETDAEEPMRHRRRTLLATAALAGLSGAGVGIAGTTGGAKRLEVELDEAEWRRRLSPEQFQVLRKHATERAGTSPLDRERRSGRFHCAGCDRPLFDSATKYDSGTGWPSFWQPIEGAVGMQTDRSLFLQTRTEVHCGRCGGHLGHVFDNGPPPTGKRYCMNGLALTFRPTAAAGPQS